MAQTDVGRACSSSKTQRQKRAPAVAITDKHSNTAQQYLHKQSIHIVVITYQLIRK